MEYEVTIHFTPVIVKVHVEPQGDSIDTLTKALIEGAKDYPSYSIQSISCELLLDKEPEKAYIDPDDKPVGFGATIHQIDKNKT